MNQHYESDTPPRSYAAMGLVCVMTSSLLMLFIGHAIWRAVFG